MLPPKLVDEEEDEGLEVVAVREDLIVVDSVVTEEDEEISVCHFPARWLVLRC